MDRAAREVMQEYKDVVLGFGESDEYSLLLRKSTVLYNRRHAKILTTLASFFTSSYVMHWSEYFPEMPLKYPPSFDARIVLYPSAREVKDYFSWRQADTHINNLYNTVFWALVQQGGQTTKQAHETLRGTISSQKHEMLFSRFNINYTALPVRFRKGSVLIREAIPDEVSIDATALESKHEKSCEQNLISQQISASDDTALSEPGKLEQSSPGAKGPSIAKAKAKSKKRSQRTQIVLLHCDIIGDVFWDDRPYLVDETSTDE
ncbi:tRNAHis guanylyltransferase [Artomyces pyxidatus]|uniref:tRNAHis guanylyltransferase n=1 Tax=Artomyces pyxidatus TaxID=48021 RepID=A0ACB8SRS0_9AGAM|nr:tRNAHis guanylyltransferase [Artomyces pyxidatus]